MIGLNPKFYYRSCFSYFTKLKLKVDLDQIAKEVQQQKILINSSSNEFLRKYQKMQNLSKDYELMQQSHKDYPSLASYQMSRTLDMEKTSKRIGQVHKSQRNNLDNMNKSTKTIQLLKNELYELYFQLENKKYDLKSIMAEMVKLKEYLADHNQYSSLVNHQDIINQQLPVIIQKGEMLVDIQERIRALKPHDSQLLQQVLNMKEQISQIFQKRGYEIFDNSFNSFQRCQYPINTLFAEEYKFIEVNPEEKEYICINSNVPGLLEFLQTRINIKEKAKIIIFTPIINDQLNGISDIKVEILSENENQQVEEDIINILNGCKEVFSSLLNFKNYRIESVKDETKSHLTIQIQNGNLMTLRCYGSFLSKRMNLKIKHFVDQEVFEEISSINVMEIPSLITLLLYQQEYQQN